VGGGEAERHEEKGEGEEEGGGGWSELWHHSGRRHSFVVGSLLGVTRTARSVRLPLERGELL
jgi:hypothetical protein